VKVQTQELITILDDIRQRIQAGDSFEGHLSYTYLDGECDAGDFFINATYRVGNLQGQGSMRVIR
jgi:hypothetical protein